MPSALDRRTNPPLKREGRKAVASREAPPSALSGISPSRGEIGGGGASAFLLPLREKVDMAASREAPLSFGCADISPTRGEIGRGGASAFLFRSWE